MNSSFLTLDADWSGTYDTTVDFSDYKPRDGLILEHLMYSPDGKWGVVTSHG